MSIHLQKAVESLKKKVLTLSTLVEENVGRAVRSVLDRDESLAQKVISADSAIDNMEIDVEEECLKILALHQPVAVDLRFIVSVLKLNSDLERIGDLAVNIAERTIFISKMNVPSKDAFDFHKMFELARKMLKLSLDSLIGYDSSIAYQVCAADDELDRMNRDIYAVVKEHVHANPASIDLYLHYLSISRCLERIGDHATNIAEDIIYMNEAKIIRHKSDEKEILDQKTI